MFKKLVPLAIIASSVACIANAESNINVSYGSNNVNVSNGGKISVDGYSIGIVFDNVTKVSSSFGYSSTSGAGLTLTTFTTGLFYELMNDKDLDLGTGSSLEAGIGYTRSELKASSSSATITDGYVIAGLNYDLALAKDLSMGLTLAGVVEDFVPTYGVNIGYDIGDGKISAGYSFNEETIGTTKVEVTGFTIGYSHNF